MKYCGTIGIFRGYCASGVNSGRFILHAGNETAAFVLQYEGK